MQPRVSTRISIQFKVKTLQIKEDIGLRNSKIDFLRLKRILQPIKNSKEEI